MYMLLFAKMFALLHCCHKKKQPLFVRLFQRSAYKVEKELDLMRFVRRQREC